MSGKHFKIKALTTIYGNQIDQIETIESNGILAGKVKSSGCPVFVVSGKFTRTEYKRALAEATNAKLPTRHIVVIADIGAYSGSNIEFLKLEHNRVNESKMSENESGNINTV